MAGEELNLPNCGYIRQVVYEKIQADSFKAETLDFFINKPIYVQNAEDILSYYERIELAILAAKYELITNGYHKSHEMVINFEKLVREALKSTNVYIGALFWLAPSMDFVPYEFRNILGEKHLDQCSHSISQFTCLALVILNLGDQIEFFLGNVPLKKLKQARSSALKQMHSYYPGFIDWNPPREYQALPDLRKMFEL